MGGRAWTEDERAELLALHREGFPARQIAQAIGRDISSVDDILRAAGETPIRVRPYSPPWTPSEDERLRERILAGAGWAEIAAAHGRTPRGCWDRWRAIRAPGDPRVPALPRALAYQPRGGVSRARPMLDSADAALSRHHRALREMGDQWDRIHAHRAGARTQVWLERSGLGAHP